MLEASVTKGRDRKAALSVLRKMMKRWGNPDVVVTGRLRSYGAALNEIGNAGREETGRWPNNRVENSHLPVRRKERAIGKFRSFETLRKFVSAQSSFHNHLSHERHLNRRGTFTRNRVAALADWRWPAAGIEINGRIRSPLCIPLAARYSVVESLWAAAISLCPIALSPVTVHRVPSVARW